MCHSLLASLVWSSHKRQKTGPGGLLFSFFLSIFSGAEASSRRTKVSAANSAKASPAEIPCASQGTPTREDMPAQNQCWRYGSPQKLRGITHLLVTRTRVSVGDMTFWQPGEAGKDFLREKNPNGLWCWKIFLHHSCMSWWYGQEFYVLCLVANPGLLSRVGFSLQPDFPELAKPKVRIRSKQRQNSLLERSGNVFLVIIHNAF